MSTATIFWIIAAILVIAIVVSLLTVRVRRRRAQASNIGLPDLGALSTGGLDEAHSGGTANRQPER